MEALKFIEIITKRTAKEWQDMQREFFLYCIKSADLTLYSQVYHLCGLDPFDGNEQMQNNFKQIAARCTVQAMKRVYEYNFKNLVVDNSEGIRKWLDDNEAEYGPYILRKCLHDDGMDGYYQDKAVWTEILDTLRSHTFITGTLVAMLASSQESPQNIAKVIESYDREDGRRLRETWANYQDAPELAALMAKPARWFSPYSADVEGLIGFFAKEVAAACRRVDRSEIYTDEDITCVGDIGIAVYYLVTYQREFHGENLIRWLRSSDEVRALGLYTGGGSNNVIITEVDRRRMQGGCVMEDTPVLMADGTVKKIQEIKQGDCLINGAGAVSCCSGEMVKTENIKYFYALNGGKPIFSLEHAIMTEDGWKCLDPESANQINADFHVTKLQVGDCYFTGSISDDGKPEYEKVIITSIQVMEFPEGKTGYDLHFAEGYHSYCAGGIICLLNYPEMTINRIEENIKNLMTEEEQQTFSKLLEENQKLFEKAIGYIAARKLVEALGKGR